MRNTRYLLDVNVLVALLDEEHIHHERAMRWFDSPSLDWGLCAFTEAGYLRVATHPDVGAFTMEEANASLESILSHPGYRYWPIQLGYLELAAPFKRRIFGHQQITDAFLLGLAIHENGALVTTDKAFRHLAGAEYRQNVLILE